MPWQQLVADVGGELLPDGRPAYREVIFSVPRQCGKTLLLLVFELDRALSWGRPQRVIYSAQTGRDAREKLLEDQAPLILHSPLKAAIQQVIRVNGGEGILLKGGSRISVVASGESAGHGKTIGLGVIDEAFDDTDSRREQALKPAMRTVPDAQLLIASTMGTDASLFLNQKVELGRAAAVEDRNDSRVAYFEWSAPEDCDIADPLTWLGCTPAIGHTIELDAVRAEYESNLATPGEFRRFALNQRTASDERVIPLEKWRAVCSRDVQPDGQVTFALDCNPERSWSSVAVADPDGNCELLDHERGTGWLVPRAQSLAQKWGAAFAIDPASPAGAFIAQLEQAGVNVIPIGGQEFHKACGAFFDAVGDGTVRVRIKAELDAACAAAKKRPIGDAWAWARKTTATDISPLVAVTIAYWAAKTVTPAKAPTYWSAEDLWSD